MAFLNFGEKNREGVDTVIKIKRVKIARVRKQTQKKQEEKKTSEMITHVTGSLDSEQIKYYD